MRLDKPLQAFAFITASIVLCALVFAIPSIQALPNSSNNTFTLNGMTVTLTKKVVTGGLVYVGEIVTSLYDEKFEITSTTVNGVNETSGSVNIVGNGFKISEVSVKDESATGSNVYDLATYVNQTGSYSVETRATTSNGIISGYFTQNMIGPIGKYSLTLTPVNGGKSYKALVTLPNGQTVDPQFYQYVDAWHGPWWAPYHLLGWILSWAAWETITAGIIFAILGVISGGVFIPAIGLVLALSAVYTAANGSIYTYWDMILLYGVVPAYFEVGFHTNQFWGQNLGQWYYCAVWPSNFGWHTGVWPVGW